VETPAQTSLQGPVAVPRRSVEVIFLKDVLPAQEEQSRRRWAMLLLAGLTLIGAIIRFTYLNHPSLWGDEAMVYWRTCGTFDDLLQLLRSDGFAPLHYELDWLLGRILKPTPTVLRLLPALSGTLTIPVMYFLSRQLLQRSTSLLVAAFTTFSGFLIFYSRDAKMYSETWFFVALNMACLFWWFRTRTLTPWLCWIAAGCAGCGMHASAAAVLAISPLLFLTQRKTNWLQSIFLALGLVIILSGPIGYYFKFNHWLQNIDERGWGASGIEWVEQFQAQSGDELLRYTGTNFLMGWTWPREETETYIRPWLVKWPKIAAETIAGFLVLSLLPWPRSLRSRAELDPPPEPQWRVFFWVALWLVLPTYVFYCHSMPDFTSPVDWFHSAITVIPDSWINLLNGRPLIGWGIAGAVLAAIAPGFFFRFTRPAFFRGAKWILAAGALLLLCQITYQICVTLSDQAILVNRRWHSIWIPRYLGFLWPAIALATAALVMRLPTRPLRGLVILILLGVNVSFGYGRIFGHNEPPTDKMAADVFDAQHDNSRTLTYTDFRTAGLGPADGTIETYPGRYYLQLHAWYQPMSPERFRELLTEFVFRDHYSYESIAEDVAGAPQVTHLIVWEEFRTRPTDVTDTLLPLLPGWNMRSEKWYPLRMAWNWEDISNFRRRDYVRVSSPQAVPPADMRNR
jgi:4-amino-4-deoxy-L-arabinose transferase-like glycosyltransferase